MGWCNANEKSDCFLCESWLRFMSQVPEDGPDCRVKSVFCFVIAPEWRHKGIAAQLLAQVCRDAKDEGFQTVEAYPKKKFASEDQDFMGPSAMYKRAGFDVYRELSMDRYIMRKRL